MAEKRKLTLRTWLGLSIALNVFLASAVIGGGFIAQKHFKKPDRSGSALMKMTEGLTPASQQKARDLITAAALAGEGDMQASRDHRKKAADLITASAEPDIVAVQAEILQARRVEASAKDKIETAVVTLLLDLPLDERTKVAASLLKTPQRAGAKALYDKKKAEGTLEKEKSGASASH